MAENNDEALESLEAVSLEDLLNLEKPLVHVKREIPDEDVVNTPTSFAKR